MKDSFGSKVSTGQCAAASQASYTIAPVAVSSIGPTEPEFVRLATLFALAGIKRGIANRKIQDGTFKSVLLREKGNKQGVRLIHWPSVKNYLHALMADQTKGNI